MSISGQITVTTAGTAVPLGSQRVWCSVAVRALPGNTGVIYIGNDGSGDVSSASGFPLSAGQAVIFDHLGALDEVWVDSSVSGEGAAWLLLGS